MGNTIWIVLAIVNIPLYFGLGWLIFRSWEDFGEAVKFWLTPNFWSMIRGEYLDDVWAEMKLAFWIATCAGSVIGEALAIEKLFY